MMSPDLQRIQHIRDYCEEIRKTIQRYGADLPYLIRTRTISAPFRSASFKSAS